MSYAELNVIAGFMQRAVSPEDVFGSLPGDPAEQQRELTKGFRRLAKALHPDAHVGEPKAAALADSLFKQLEQFRDEALSRVAAGTYGQRVPMPDRQPIVIKGRYVVEKLLAVGDVSDVHLAFLESSARRKPLLLKVARHMADNDLLRAEQSALERVRAVLPAATWRQAVPNVSDSFLLDNGGGRRRVNVMEQFAGFHDGEVIRRRLPGGVDGRTVGWMWKRLLVLMEWVHKAGYIHGAVLPRHVMFYPDNDGNTVRDPRKHSIRLVDWVYAVEYKSRTRLSAWVRDQARLYAPEIQAKGHLGPWTDLYMGAMSMLYLAGAEIDERGGVATMKNLGVPNSIVASLLGCVSADIGRRPQSVGKYFEGFVELLRKEYGAPKWWDFNLPQAV